MRTVSACLIVRNEAATLGRCLLTIVKDVEEIIVVDTGSTDATMDIARDYGARVFQVPWQDDFAAARNETLKHATCDYIFWMDADDILCRAHPEAFTDLVDSVGPRGAMFAVKSIDVKTGCTVQAQHWRLFPNHRGLQWYGRLHEQIGGDGLQSYLEVPVTNWVWIEHLGYDTSPEVMMAKCERNLRLTNLTIEEALAAEDLITLYGALFDRGRMLAFLGRPQECLDDMKCAIQVWHKAGCPEWLSAHAAYAYAADAARAMQWPAAVKAIEASTPRELISAELLCCVALVLEKEEPAEAVARYIRAMLDPDVIHPAVHDTQFSTKVPRERLAALGYRLP